MTFIVKTRGAGGFVVADYRCPHHGVFEATVQRTDSGDAPDTQECPVVVADDGITEYCEEPSPWTISAPRVHTQFVISATQGKSAPKPHRDAMDTRLIAEGRKNEYRAQRKKLKEERRHRRVMELLK